MKTFEKVEKEIRKEYEAVLYREIQNEYLQAENKGKVKIYKVTLQDIVFITELTENEVKKTISYAFDLLEELKNINNNGITKEKLMKLENDAKEEYKNLDEDMKQMFISKHLYTCIRTDKLFEIEEEIFDLYRVGGAYKLILSKPALDSVIYAVFDTIVDHFDDEMMYLQSAYFLTRGIMRIRAKEL